MENGVAGATGKTGSLAYSQLKAAGFETRALVRNATKAQEILHCGSCSEQDGVFLGDVTKPETLPAAMANVTRLIIAVGATFEVTWHGIEYPKGGFPIDIDFHGAKNQIIAAGESTLLGPSVQCQCFSPLRAVAWLASV
jgi:hypothetical protein